MKQFSSFFVLVSVLLGACTSPHEEVSPWDETLSVEQNIAKNAIALENNEDFSFLDDIVRNRSVIILGEEGHADYSTFELKLKMINYLQNRGFRSVACEGLSFITSYVFSNPKYADLTKDWTISPFVWWGSKDLLSDSQLFQSFLETMKERKIRIWGIDYYPTNYDMIAVKKILDEYSNNTLWIYWLRLVELYFQKYAGLPERLSVTEQYDLMRMIDRISNYTQYMMHSKGASMELEAIMQWIRNLNMAFSHVESLDTVENLIANLSPVVTLGIRNRDVQMAENINWILKNFPDEKLIVWTANFHGAKDISQTRYPADSLLYFNIQCMGEFLHASLGDKMYSLAFTSYSKGSEAGMLEKEIAHAIDDAPFGFIDFEPLRFADGYRDKEFGSSVIGKKSGKWLYIFDGLYYIRDQKREESIVEK